MIWTLRIECIGGRYLDNECVRVLEIDSEASLMELHDAIQDAVGFDRDHLFEFFAGRSYRNRKLVFNDSFDGEQSFDRYGILTLEQLYPLPKSCKLYYHFDFGDDWYFEIGKFRRKPMVREPGVEYPRIIASIGQHPEQYGSWEEE
jgi:hypothetical protein